MLFGHCRLVFSAAADFTRDFKMLLKRLYIGTIQMNTTSCIFPARCSTSTSEQFDLVGHNDRTSHRLCVRGNMTQVYVPSIALCSSLWLFKSVDEFFFCSVGSASSNSSAVLVACCNKTKIQLCLNDPVQVFMPLIRPPLLSSSAPPASERTPPPSVWLQRW